MKKIENINHKESKWIEIVIAIASCLIVTALGVSILIAELSTLHIIFGSIFIFGGLSLLLSVVMYIFRKESKNERNAKSTKRN